MEISTTRLNADEGPPKRRLVRPSLLLMSALITILTASPDSTSAACNNCGAWRRLPRQKRTKEPGARTLPLNPRSPEDTTFIAKLMRGGSCAAKFAPWLYNIVGVPRAVSAKTKEIHRRGFLDMDGFGYDEDTLPICGSWWIRASQRHGASNHRGTIAYYLASASDDCRSSRELITKVSYYAHRLHGLLPSASGWRDGWLIAEFEFG